jgi:hypothetical protein
MPNIRCDDCHRRLLHPPVREARRNFCDDKCREHWKRRSARSLDCNERATEVLRCPPS